MAEGKNVILIYRDWINTFDSLTDEEAGKLIKHLFRYINDKNPEAPDRLTSLLFEPIKQTLKRDLKKYEAICLRNKENGSKGGRPKQGNDLKPKKPSGLFGNPKNPDEPDRDIDNDIDNDIDIENDNDKKVKFNFKKSLLLLGIENQIILDWLEVRKRKKATNSETAFNAIKKQIELSGKTANECIKIAVEKSWSGFDVKWLNNSQNANNSTAHRGTGERTDSYWHREV